MMRPPIRPWAGVCLLPLVILSACRPSGPKLESSAERESSAGAGAVLIAVPASAPVSGPAPAPSQSPISVPEVSVDRLDREVAERVRQARAAVLSARDSGSAWGEYGQVLHAAEFESAAEMAYGRAVERLPDEVRWWHLLGLLQIGHQRDEGLRSLRRAVELTGTTNVASRLALARSLVERGRWLEAIPGLEQLLVGEPGLPPARLELARVRLAQDQAAAALGLLAPCLTNPYTARQAWLLAAQAQGRLGHGDVAAAAARQAVRHPAGVAWPDPFLREVRLLQLGRAALADQVHQLLTQQRLAEAESEILRLIARSPENPEVWLLQGRLRWMQRNYREAEQCFRRVLSAQPGSLNGTLQLGLALYGQSQWTEAAAVFQRAVELKPDFAQAHYNLGMAQARSGQASAAIQSLQRSLRCDPEDPVAHTALAELHLESGDLDSARRELQQALELDPGSSTARTLQARLQTLRPAHGESGRGK